MTSEHRAGSFSAVQNYDNDDEAWATDDIGQLQVEVRPRPLRLHGDLGSVTSASVP